MIPKEPKRASESLHDQEEVSDIISLHRGGSILLFEQW